MRIIIVIGLVALLIHQQAHSIDALRLFTTSSFATSVNKVKGSTILAHHSTTTSSSHRNGIKLQHNQFSIPSARTWSTTQSGSIQDSIEFFSQVNSGEPLTEPTPLQEDDSISISEMVSTTDCDIDRSSYTPIESSEESVIDNDLIINDVDDIASTMSHDVIIPSDATTQNTQNSQTKSIRSKQAYPRELSIFVGMIPRNLNDTIVREAIIQKLGDIPALSIFVPAATGQPKADGLLLKGIAYVNLENSEIRQKAYLRLQGLIIEGYQARIDYGESNSHKIAKQSDNVNRQIIQQRYYNQQMQQQQGMSSGYGGRQNMNYDPQQAQVQQAYYGGYGVPPVYHGQPVYYPPPVPAGYYPPPPAVAAAYGQPYYYPMPMMPAYPGQPYATYPPPPQPQQQRQNNRRQQSMTTQPAVEAMTQQDQHPMNPSQEQQMQGGNQGRGYQRQPRQRELSDPSKTIYISYVPFSLTVTQLSEAIEKATGTAPLHVKIVPSRDDPVKRFAFATVHSEEERDEIINNHPTLTLSNGENITLTSYQSKTKLVKVFIGNLPYEANDELLREMLEDVVGVNSFHSVKVGYDYDGRQKGFAFASFYSLDVANKAIEKLNGVEVLTRTIVVQLARGKDSVVAGGDKKVEGNLDNERLNNAESISSEPEVSVSIANNETSSEA